MTLHVVAVQLGFSASFSPKNTRVTPGWKPVPVIVTGVPPVVGPSCRSSAVTVGGAGVGAAVGVGVGLGLTVGVREGVEVGIVVGIAVGAGIDLSSGSTVKLRVFVPTLPARSVARAVMV